MHQNQRAFLTILLGITVITLPAAVIPAGNALISCDRELRKTLEAVQAWRRTHNGEYPPFLYRMKDIRLLPRQAAICPDVVREDERANAKHLLTSSRGDGKDPEGWYEYEFSDETDKYEGEKPWLPPGAAPFTRQDLKTALLRRPLHEQIPILRCSSHRDIAPEEYKKDGITFRNLTDQGSVYWSGELWEQNWLSDVPYPCRQTIVLYGLKGPPFHTDIAPNLTTALDLRPWSSGFGDHPWWWTVPLFDYPQRSHTAPHLGPFFKGKHGTVAHVGGTAWWIDGVAQLQGGLTSDERQVFEQSRRQSFLWERTGLPINRRFLRAAWLQGTIWTAQPGDVAGELVWHYSDGESQRVPIAYGKTTARFWADAPQIALELEFPEPSWNFRETAEAVGRERWLRLYQQTWTNPHPAKLVKTLDFVSNPECPAAPFLIAINVYP